MADTCLRCQLPHAPEASCVDAQSGAMEKLLGLIAGSPVPCRGCRASVYWVTHKNGKRAPYTVAGLNHFVDCPAAKEFKR